MTRKHIFAKPRPEGWIPQPGEEVVVADVPGTLAHLASGGVVRMVTGDIVRVLITYGRQAKEYQFLLDQVRPVRRKRSS